MTARPPLDISQPGADRPGLSAENKGELQRLAKKSKNGQKLTPVELGRLAAFQLIGNKEDAARAARLIARAKRQKEKKT